MKVLVITEKFIEFKLFLLINSFIRKKKDLIRNKKMITNNMKKCILTLLKIRTKKVININGMLFNNPFLYRLRDRVKSINPFNGLLEATNPPSEPYKIWTNKLCKTDEIPYMHPKFIIKSLKSYFIFIDLKPMNTIIKK